MKLTVIYARNPGALLYILSLVILVKPAIMQEEILLTTAEMKGQCNGFHLATCTYLLL